MTKDPRVYLAHILECVQKIELFTADGKGRFMRDGMVQDAVMRNFEIIGEAAKRLDDSYRTAHPEIPWRALAGLRDVLIHQYEGVDPERVWTIVERELPNLCEAIAALLPPLDQLERELAGEEDAPEQDR
ncbi:MAG: DUF86 domain-containing protein [Chloroflexi bacterium]|nr:DUF86 domain-containing protein [Chloroflexota bacterium]